MSTWKRFLLLGSLGLTLLAGLLLTSSASGSRAAFAIGCNSIAKGSWAENCPITEGNMSFFTVAIQTVVNGSRTGCSTGTIDGDFGPNTLNGVECFQRARGLPPDGVLGPRTWEALQNTLICNLINNVALLCHLPASSTITFKEELNNSDIWFVLFNGRFCEMVDNSLQCQS